MNKKLQIQDNNEVLLAINRFNEEIKHCPIDKVNRLRTCNAYVYETPSFYVLRSYNNVVAIIEKSTDTCYDFFKICLRIHSGISTAHQQV